MKKNLVRLCAVVITNMLGADPASARRLMTNMLDRASHEHAGVVRRPICRVCWMKTNTRARPPLRDDPQLTARMLGLSLLLQ